LGGQRSFRFLQKLKKMRTEEKTEMGWGSSGGGGRTVEVVSPVLRVERVKIDRRALCNVGRNGNADGEMTGLEKR